MSILIINLINEEKSLHYNEFVKPIENIVKQIKTDYIIKHFKKITQKDIEKANKIIVCGTPLIQIDMQNQIEQFEYLKNLNKPYLGICAGTQLISKIYGGKESMNPEIGLFKPTILKEDKIIQKKDLNEIYCLHNLEISIPKEFEIYAKTLQPQIVKHKTLPIYGCFFHPEVRNNNIIINFINYNF